MSRKSDFELKDEGQNFGGLRFEHPTISDEDFRKLIKRAYRESMLNPRKLINLAFMLKPSDLFIFGAYSIKTNSI